MQSFMRKNLLSWFILTAGIGVLFTQYYITSVFILVNGFFLLLLNTFDDYENYDSYSEYLESNIDSLHDEEEDKDEIINMPSKLDIDYKETFTNYSKTNFPPLPLSISSSEDEIQSEAFSETTKITIMKRTHSMSCYDTYRQRSKSLVNTTRHMKHTHLKYE